MKQLSLVESAPKQSDTLQLIARTPAPLTANTPRDLLQGVIPYHEVERRLEEYLREELARYDSIKVVPLAENDITAKWRLSSALQKSIRRGYVKDSIRYARTYHGLDPAGFWTRLVVIAFEDVGVGDVGAVALTLAAARSKIFRHKAGGDEKVLNYIVKLLADSLKDRSVCDFPQSLSYTPQSPDDLSKLRKASLAELSAIALSEGHSFDFRTSAAWLLAGTDKYENPKLPLRVGTREVFTATIEQMNIPPLVKYITLRGMTACRYAMNLVYPFVWQMMDNSPSTKVIETGFPERHYIGGLPEEAYDKHTREGKSSLHYFIKACVPVNEYLTRLSIAGTDEALGAVGIAVFIGEGALLDRRLDFEGAERIYSMTEQGDYEKNGLTLDTGRALSRLIMENYETLRRARIRVVEGKKG